MLPMAASSVAAWIARLVGAPSLDTRLSFPLRGGEVLRIDHPRPTVATLLVTRGIVWLTFTPADGDTILRVGDRIDLANVWPVVAQAIGEDAELDVTQAPPPSDS